MPRRSMAEVLYGALLRLYPAEFRARYGRDMREMFRDGLRDRRRHPWARLAFWARTSRDVFSSAVGVRVAPVWRHRGPHSAPLTAHRRSRPFGTIMDQLLLDTRFAVRSMLKHRAFTILSVVTIALGIGANSAIFSVVNAVLLRPLPYDRPEELAVVWTQFPADNQLAFPVSTAEYIDYRADNDAFSELGAFSPRTVTVTGSGPAQRANAVGVTASLFDVLRVRPAIGGAFVESELQTAGGQFVLLSDAYWRARHGGDPNVVGRTMLIDGQTFEIHGVMPAGVNPPGIQADLWLPFVFDRSRIGNRSGHYLTVVGRLQPGATVQSAVSEMNGILMRWEESYAGLHTNHPDVHPLTVVSLDDQLLGGVRPAMAVLSVAVGLVLLLACANVANLLMARGEARAREVGVRAALGAGRGRIVRQLLTEGLALAAVGGALGLGLATFATRALLRLDPGGIPRLSEVGLDARVVVFTGFVAVVTGLVFGVVPALRASRVDLQAVIGAGGRGGALSRESRRTLNGLVVAQVAVAVVLLIGAGLLIKSFLLLRSQDPGFLTQQRLAFDVSLPTARYPSLDEVLQFHDAVAREIGALPGVDDVTAVRNLPLRTGSRQEGITIEGRDDDVDGGGYTVEYQGAWPGYFGLMGVPLQAGRVFTEADRGDAPRVGIINATAARAYFAGEDPVGRRVRALFAGDGSPWITVVGVVGDVRQNGLDGSPLPELYLPAAQTPLRTWPWLRTHSVVIRTALDPSVVAGSVREAVARVDPDIPVANLESLDAVIESTMTADRFVTLLLAVFAATALAIATVGVYGVISFSVARRGREIGIRMALGAQGSRLMKNVLTHGIGMAGLGAAIGLGASAVGSRVLQSQLYGVGAIDVTVFAAASLLMVLVSVVAALIPARRATLVDPNQSLRE